MGTGYQNVFTVVWNRAVAWFTRSRGEQLWLGLAVQDDIIGRRRIGIAHAARTEHIAVLGKTGSGKTSLLRYLVSQDIQAGHGFAFFDLHGDTTPYILGLIAEEESRRSTDLSSRVILVDPSDRERSVGINILDAVDEQDAFVEIAETVDILKHRWNLDTLGVRTDELLRHSLFVLLSNRLTLLEIRPLLTSAEFRRQCVQRTIAGESRAYFETRYDLLSLQNQAVYREAILNKISIYTADPHFRHLLGQPKSTVNLRQAVDRGAFVIFNLEKGRLGEEAATLGALLLAKLKHAILARKTRRLFTLYCDELQNLVAYDAAIDVLLSEARKFGVGVISANQYLDQYSTAMRASILAMGSHVLFQLSGLDASRMSHWFGAGRQTADRLRTLPQRHGLVSSRTDRLTEIVVPHMRQPNIMPIDILGRVRGRWTKDRRAVERDIRQRHAVADVRKDEREEAWT